MNNTSDVVRLDGEPSVLLATGADSLYLRFPSAFLRPLRLYRAWRSGAVITRKLELNKAYLRHNLVDSIGPMVRYKVIAVEDRLAGDDVGPKRFSLSWWQYCRASSATAHSTSVILLLSGVALYGQSAELSVNEGRDFRMSWSNAPQAWRDKPSYELVVDLLDQFLGYLQSLGIAIRPGRSCVVTIGDPQPTIVADIGYRVGGRTWTHIRTAEGFKPAFVPAATDLTPSDQR